MVTKIHVTVHNKSRTNHVYRTGMGIQDQLCGAKIPLNERRVFTFDKKDDFGPQEKWCNRCIGIIADEVRRGILDRLPILEYVWGMSITKKKKSEEMDSIRTQLTIDSEELEIKIIAGVSTGARGNFSGKVEKTIVFDWDKLDSMKELAEETEGVEEIKITVFAEKEPEEA